MLYGKGSNKSLRPCESNYPERTPLLCVLFVSVNQLMWHIAMTSFLLSRRRCWVHLEIKDIISLILNESAHHHFHSVQASSGILLYETPSRWSQIECNLSLSKVWCPLVGGKGTKIEIASQYYNLLKLNCNWTIITCKMERQFLFPPQAC